MRLTRRVVGGLASGGLAAGLLLSAQLVVAQQQFFTAVADLPLMPGLADPADAALVFDAPGGRIVELAATGAVAAAAVREFYGATLPQLGWQPLGGDRWSREGEELGLEIESTAGVVTVRFSIAPRAVTAP